ncbi:cysteine proteinase COT44-like [Bidens hawaiensis]|uniref:cysteine proteinase COT44-like n=1 Tax=Bidens hawaiensis TaxID=980011 RepID=UPI00404AC471
MKSMLISHYKFILSPPIFNPPSFNTMKLPSMVVLLPFVMISVASAIDDRPFSGQRTDNDFNDMFLSWLTKYGKVYKVDGEKEKRFQIFKDNLRYIDQHNSGGHSYKLGLNKFADLTVEEYRLLYTRERMIDSKRKLNNVNRYSIRSGDALPDSIDWRTKGAVAAIKDQGSCGCCWAFSAIGSVEALHQIVTGDLITLSEQELVDCDTLYNFGCNGGQMNLAFEFIIKNDGIDSDKDYPYIGMDGICNNTRKSAKVVSIYGYEYVSENDESALQKAVANQPVAVAIDSHSQDFHLYESGIFNSPCGTNLDHGVVLVGYGSEDGNDYWIVRNSWGVGWGEQGYIRMERNVPEKEGKCGIAMAASYPIKNAFPINNGLNPTKRASILVPFLFLILIEVALSFV